MHRKQLPVLNPCHESWDEMDGDRERRHCESCDRDVFNLSAMTAEEAKKVVDAARTRKTCVRYRVGADGMVMFAPNGAPVASPIFGLKPIALGLGLLAGAAAFSTTQPVMGEIAPPAIAQPQTPPFVVEREVMGKLAVERPIVIKPPPPSPRHEEIMGDLAIDPSEP